MGTFAKFTIHHHEMDPVKLVRLKEAFKDLLAVRKEIEDDFKATERYALLEKMVKAGSRVNLTWNSSNRIDVGYQLEEDFFANKQGSQPLYLGEKTINTLLNGKLLTDAEKRTLVERVTNGAIPAPTDGRA